MRRTAAIREDITGQSAPSLERQNGEKERERERLEEIKSLMRMSASDIRVVN